MPIVRAGVVAVGIAVLLTMLHWTWITDAPHLDADFHTDAWFMQHQAASLRQSLMPPLFLTTDAAAFYPAFVFYGGTLFVLGGAITLLVGSAQVAEIIISLLALAAGYGGWVWLARMAGVRSWPAHAPAILYVTAPYVLSNINARQAFAEIVATAVMPLMVASGLSVLRADRLRFGPAAALAVSVVAFGGSHNITLLWGTTILAVGVMAVLVWVPAARRQLSTRGVLRVLVIVVPALSVNARYLLPDLAYHSDTVIASRIGEWRAMLTGAHSELAARYLFALGRPSALAESGLVITLPVVAMGWVVVVAVADRGQWRGTWARLLAVLSLLTAGVFAVMTHPRWILALPDAWQMIQFSYRLESFVLFGICGAVLAVLVLAGGRRRRWLIALLLPILALSVIGAGIQRHDAPRSANAITMLIDVSAPFSVGDFADAKLPQYPVDPGGTFLVLKRKDVKRSRVVRDVRAEPGDVIYTDLVTPARLLHIQGAHVIGRWPGPALNAGWQSRWALVLQVDDDVKMGKARIVIEEGHSLPIVAGKIISLLGLLGLAAVSIAILTETMRRRASGSYATW